MREYSQSWMLLPISLTIAFFTSIASAQSNITYDDTNFSMQYSTSPAWNTDVWAQQSPPPYNGTNHGSPNPGAQMTFTFTGNAIYIYGYKWTDHGFRTFLIDDTREIQCDGRTGEQGSRALLFYRTSTSDADHTLTIKNTGTQGQYLNLDYVVITQGGNQSNNTQTEGTTGKSTPKKSFPIAIVAGAAGGAILLLLSVWLAFYIIRRRRRQAYLAREADVALRSSTSSPPPLSLGPGRGYTDNKPNPTGGRGRLTSMDHAALATHPIQGQGRAHSHSIDEGSMQPLLGGSMGYDHRFQSSIDYTPNHITEFGVPLSGLQRPLSNDFSNWYPGQSHAAASQAGFGAPVRRTSYTPVTIPQQHVAPVPVITNPPPGQISHPLSPQPQLQRQEAATQDPAGPGPSSSISASAQQGNSGLPPPAYSPN